MRYDLTGGGALQGGEGMIQEPDIQRRLVRRLGLRERMPAPTLSPEIQPVVIVEDVREPQWETGNLKPCWGVTRIALDELTWTHIWLMNPSDSGVRAIVDRVELSAESNTLIFLCKTYTHLITVLNDTPCSYQHARDSGTSLLSPKVPVCRLKSNEWATNPNPMHHGAAVLARSPWSVPLFGVVLEPGWGMYASAENSNLLASFQWREVLLEPQP